MTFRAGIWTTNDKIKRETGNDGQEHKLMTLSKILLFFMSNGGYQYLEPAFHNQYFEGLVKI